MNAASTRESGLIIGTTRLRLAALMKDHSDEGQEAGRLPLLGRFTGDHRPLEISLVNDTLRGSSEMNTTDVNQISVNLVSLVSHVNLVSLASLLENEIAIGIPLVDPKDPRHPIEESMRKTIRANPLETLLVTTNPGPITLLKIGHIQLIRMNHRITRRHLCEEAHPPKATRAIHINRSRLLATPTLLLMAPQA